MKILLAIILVVFACGHLKAQEALGKSRAEIRELIKANSSVKLSLGNNCDTLNMPNGLKTITYYKNDICYASKSIMPMEYLYMVTEAMTKNLYKKLTENTWVNQAGTVKVEITVEKDKNRFIVDTSQNQAY